MSDKAGAADGAPGFPGLPPGAGMPGGSFDLSALQNVLSDPNIKNMAEQIAQDPAFARMTQALQQSMSSLAQDPQAAQGMFAGMAGMPGMPGMPAAANGAAAAPGPGAQGFDTAKYMEAMTGVLQNPQFMEMAEKLGHQIMQQDPAMMEMMQGMQNPAYRENIEGRLAELKQDPELASVMEEIEKGGPAAMMKYWNDPTVLSKLGSAMGEAFSPEELAAGGVLGAPTADGEAKEGEEGAEEEGELDVHSAASTGDVEALRELLKSGAPVDEADEEGRTPLHFACGYGENECAEVLIAEGANVNASDNNKNTALHYAAGYGQAKGVELLLKHHADRTAKNLDGKTALEVAQLNEQKEAADALSKE